MHTFSQLHAKCLLGQLVFGIVNASLWKKKILTKYVAMQNSNIQLWMHQDEFYSNTSFLLFYVCTQTAFEGAK